MKKMFLAVAFATVCLVSNAQVYLGGSLNFSSMSPEHGDSYNTFSFQPEVGYAFSDVLSIGLNLGYESNSLTDQSIFTFAPYARYTFYTMDKISLFIDGQVSYNSVSNNGTTSSFGLAFRPGIAYSITDKVSLVTKVGSLGFVSGDGYSSFGFNADASIYSLGIFYNF